ncbi:MAG: hypothetical protein K8H74_17850 [Notoacmeibacter sp.]|nr:hypothetical protein [Notoacmeibacter sp.]
MTARLLNWPVGVEWANYAILEGPRTIGAGGGFSFAGLAQTVRSPFGLWRVRITLPEMRGAEARRVRGWITAQHGGANATRVPWQEPEIMTRAEAGASGPLVQTWSNGEYWSNGLGWSARYPTETAGAAAAKGDTSVVLGSDHWGQSLDDGDRFGFFPFHLAVYEVTEVLAAGQYRIWPPLRKAVAATDGATMRPTMAMKLLTEPKLPYNRNLMPEIDLDFLEVKDEIVRAWFTG